LTLRAKVGSQEVCVTDVGPAEQTTQDDRFLEEYDRDFRNFKIIDLGQVTFGVSAEGLPVVADPSE